MSSVTVTFVTYHEPLSTNLMPITPELRTYALSAYRNLLRAASDTFSGDGQVLQAFRAKVRAETIKGRVETDPVSYEANVKHAQEVAAVLRRNVVQGVQVRSTAKSDDGKDVWRLRINEHTELGSNETIKQASCGLPKADDANNRRARKRDAKRLKEGETAAIHAVSDIPLSSSSIVDAESNDTTLPRNYSALKRAHKERKLPTLREEDLEESFVRGMGSGPGGQSINKTNNNVQLLHKPTGIRVNCQETRSLSQNRMFARRILLAKLDQLENPGISKTDLIRAKMNERERRRRKKAKKKAKTTEQAN
ncbi:hypothetical protein BD410DRAFT_825206 [Rickenella mellea]|uniref:Prokaryotic-type class I peptide chain release factors domain-containing protein n=1 Tax=Rickenella mellea TaxID=50990 RepID=A0A4Y7QL83_9AGAM|nr:hypothetical protein BD410DRAFT_825206 [Rickenella mellea]